MSDVEIQGERMEQMHVFKYLECLVNGRGTEKVECENIH